VKILRNVRYFTFYVRYFTLRYATDQHVRINVTLRFLTLRYVTWGWKTGITYSTNVLYLSIYNVLFSRVSLLHPVLVNEDVYETIFTNIPDKMRSCLQSVLTVATACCASCSRTTSQMPVYGVPLTARKTPLLHVSVYMSHYVRYVCCHV